MLLVVDNHDSFTWNLVHTLGRFATDVHVVQGDAIDLDDVRRWSPRGIVLSPGPGRPESSGIGMALVRAIGGQVPLLGVCLGHQMICAALGARVAHAPRLMHGRTSVITHDGQGVFEGLPPSLAVARYHSLIVPAETLPPELAPSAFSEEGELMAVHHVTLPIQGLQFHPESFMTEHGVEMIGRFVSGLAAR
jgi:anthranilate synthase/aminodeoxychorismate synthase-like glutamine amidotransferase